ncbi:VOC family protein [Paraburkholderia nemoris]|uniref:VOC family protein n=1 Tax=Paraburkholderia nemoris TaxID=2793076 RepID=UPI0038B72F8E
MNIEAKSTQSDLVFSHLGFFVTDLVLQATFYQGALGFTRTDEGRLGTTDIVFLSRDPDEHHQIVLMAGRPQDLRFNVINQISLRVPSLQALRKYRAQLAASGATDIQSVTHGNAISVYCRDPEGNRLEIYMNTPWYCEQPLRIDINLDQSDAEIFSQSEEIARNSPRFQSRETWRAAMTERMTHDRQVAGHENAVKHT